MKVNFKLGGINLGPNLKDWESTLGGRTMIVGADVTHPGKGDRSCPSLAGVVATCDQQAIHYLASARLQPNNTEVSLPYSCVFTMLNHPTILPV